MDGLPVLPPLNSNMHMTDALLQHAQRLPTGTRWLLALVFGLHALLGAVLGLSVDEAHYALYAAHPALSYFDHPPLVGWAQWPLVALGAPTVVLRLVPGLLWLGTLLLVYHLARRLQAAAPGGASEQAGFWAVASLLLAPLMHILGISLLPDTLLMFWSAALMLQTLRLMQRTQPPALSQWLLLGALLGLAGLSKYTAIFTAAAVALCLLRAHGMAVLRQPGLWLGTLLALLIVSPVPIWNAQNHWVSFVYQAKHGAGSGWQGLNVARFGLLQLLAYGPLLLWGWQGLRVATAAQRSLLAFFVIPFVVLAYLSGGGSSLPHWTAPAWVALAPFAGVGLARTWAAGKPWAVRALVLLQALACVALPAAMVSAGMPFLQGQAASAQAGNAPNPFADLHGWDAAGERAQALAVQHGLDALAVQNWTLASRIGWYARPLKVHVLHDGFDQFDLWAGKLAAGGSALLVDWSQLPYETPLGAHGFAQCSWLERQEVQRLGYAVSSFDFYACSGWSGAPQPRLRSMPLQPGADAARSTATP
ncbi:glycosyl transferase [Rhodoferax lacus]|uniref:Glycosyl transferase n=2 Tax=Rhodoferax lacus TaxID=2184758 RepID=A0A3E1RAE1_9BURK|nr:glycosyl transferase [Rhodoferax lacus]